MIGQQILPFLKDDFQRDRGWGKYSKDRAVPAVIEALAQTLERLNHHDLNTQIDALEALEALPKDATQRALEQALTAAKRYVIAALMNYVPESEQEAFLTEVLDQAAWRAYQKTPTPKPSNAANSQPLDFVRNAINTGNYDQLLKDRQLPKAERAIVRALQKDRDNPALKLRLFAYERKLSLKDGRPSASRRGKRPPSSSSKNGRVSNLTERAFKSQGNFQEEKPIIMMMAQKHRLETNLTRKHFSKRQRELADKRLDSLNHTITDRLQMIPAH